MQRVPCQSPVATNIVLITSVRPSLSIVADLEVSFVYLITVIVISKLPELVVVHLSVTNMAHHLTRLCAITPNTASNLTHLCLLIYLVAYLASRLSTQLVKVTKPWMPQSLIGTDSIFWSELQQFANKIQP